MVLLEDTSCCSHLWAAVLSQVRSHWLAKQASTAACKSSEALAGGGRGPFHGAHLTKWFGMENNS